VISGAEAEDSAAAFLQRAGLAITERNYRCRFGEIDIIANDGGVIVFVEVRRRVSSSFGGAAASITHAKRERLVRTARHYLAGVHRTPACRFDALLLQGDPGEWQWIRNAFGE
jgi:putative endonuclease